MAQTAACGGKSSFRIFPLVTWKQKDNYYKKFFVIWPLFGRIQKRLGGEYPTDSWFFLPFYAKRQTPFGEIRHFLYPFFSYQRNENVRNRFREWQTPWPLLKITRGDNYWKTYIWPFWGKARVRQRFEKEFALYPIYRLNTIKANTSVTTERYVLPFYWNRVERDLEGEMLRKRVKWWPFMDGLKDTRGEEKSLFRLLSPLWFRDPNGFERNYGDFWTFYSVMQYPSGEKGRRILWYRWYRPSLPGKTALHTETNGQGASAAVEAGPPDSQLGSQSEYIIKGNPFIKDLIEPFKE